MKKFLLPLVALAALVIVACSSSPAETVTKTATDKIENAKSVDELKAAVTEYATEIGKIAKEDKDAKVSESVTNKLSETLEKKMKELNASESDQMEIGFAMLGALMEASGAENLEDLMGE